MNRFVGRQRELGQLDDILHAATSTGRGQLVVMRGRRRVGKSRLAEMFLERHREVPSLFFAATRGRPAPREREAFAAAVAGSSLPAAGFFDVATEYGTWESMLRLLGKAPPATPQIVVLDELPYLLSQDASIEGELQTAWDRHLGTRPIMMILVGSDLAMMEALTEYGRPLYDRAQSILRVDPLTPAEVASLYRLEPDDALEVFAALGGFPQLAAHWRPGDTLRTYLERSLSHSATPLVVTGERIISAEFPETHQTRLVLRAMGTGERTFTGIGRRSGVPRQSLDRVLTILQEKRVVTKEYPLPTSKESRYDIADPYLKFWLTFIDENLVHIDRGRSDVLMDAWERSWPTYLGQAVEPVIREAIRRILPNERFGSAKYCGHYWTRDGRVEIDVTGSERKNGEGLAFVGSIKWRAQRPFETEDLRALVRSAAAVPGYTAKTRLIVISRTGCTAAGADLHLRPADLVTALGD